MLDLPVMDLSNYIPALLTSLNNKLSAGASACYREHFGIGVVEWRVLAMLAVEDNIPANRICQVVGLDKAAVSRTLQALEKKGYISSLSDKEDARRMVLSLTPAGHALYTDVWKVASQREQLLLATLSPDEISAFVKTLNEMHAQLDAVNAVSPD